MSRKEPRSPTGEIYLLSAFIKLIAEATRVERKPKGSGYKEEDWSEGYSRLRVTS